MSLFTTGPRAPQIFGTGHVAAISGVSMRQLQWWDEQSFVRPATKTGNRRTYAPEQVIFIMVIGELLHRPPSRMIKFRKLKPQILRRLKQAEERFPGDLYLITDGKTVELATSMSETLAVTLRFAGAVVVHLSPIISLVRACQEKKKVA